MKQRFLYVRWRTEEGVTVCHSLLGQVLVALNMPVVNQFEVLIGNAAQRFDPDGRLNDEPIRQSIKKLPGALVRLVKTNRDSTKQAA